MIKREDVETKFNISRSNLLWVIAFSVINLLLALFNTEIFFLFSLTFPNILIEIGQLIAIELNNSIFILVGVIMAIITIVLYVICYLLSKKYKAFILVSLILFSIDTIILLCVSVMTLNISSIIDIAVHIWVIYYLINGVKAWLNLKNLSFDEETEVIDISEETRATIDVDTTQQSIAIRPQTKKGRTIISQDFNNLKITVRRVYGATELSINGMVYDEQKGLGLIETNYTLEAYVQNVSIKVTMESSTTMCLYVNENLLAKNEHLH